MGSPHDRHLALSHIHPNTGTLSYHLMGVLHRGHRDPGATIDTSSGIRVMHTFRKLPITNPNAKTNAVINGSPLMSLATHCAIHIPGPQRARARPVSDA